MGYDKSGYTHNMQYAKNIKGGKHELMTHHNGVSPIATTSPQKRDMGRMDVSPMEYKGYADKAFDYKY